jgi:microcystin-dependent protein
MAIKWGGTWERWGAGRVAVSLDLNDPLFSTVGNEIGAKAHTLNEDEMPSHRHALHTWATGTQQGTFNDLNRPAAGPVSGNSSVTMTGAVQNAGGGQPHNNIQPSKVCYTYIRTG